MSTISGLDRKDRAFARRVVVHGAEKLLTRPQDVHYTQGPDRWDGIDHHKHIWQGDLFPFYGDCSSTATFLLWRALAVPFKVKDVVNGMAWRAGYTGTMLQHGRVIHRESRIEPGDLALYGSGPPGHHVAVCLGDGLVFSHGSEGGPYKLNLHYRGDLMCVRRYI